MEIVVVGDGKNIIHNISKTFEETITGTALSQTSQVLQKLSQLLVLWVGCTCIERRNIGAANCIPYYFRVRNTTYAAPVKHMAKYSELKVSFERLADVIDTPVKSDRLQISLFLQSTEMLVLKM